MLAKYTIAGLAGTALLATVAFAQQPSTSTDSPKMAPAAASDTSSSPSSFQGNWRASKMVGLSVYNDKNESVGSINDFLTDKNGKITAVIIGVGGFLGVGQKDVEIPFTDLKMMTRNNKNWLALDRTKDQLQNAPTFDKSSLKLP